MRVDLSHNLVATQWREINLKEDDELPALKLQLSRHTGSEPGDIEVTVFDADGKELGRLESSLRAAGVQPGFRLHVVDENPNSVLRTLNAEPVPKFVLSEEKYKARPNNARQFLERLRQEQPERFGDARRAEEASVLPVEYNELCLKRFQMSHAEVQTRGVDCRVKHTSARGKLLWIGFPSPLLVKEFNLRPGLLYGGVRLTEPGAVGVFNGIEPETGKMLFDCAGAKRGILVELESVTAPSEGGDVLPDEF